MDVEQTAPSAEDKGKGTPTAPSNGKRFEIKKWNAVAMWSWAICTDTCAICRNNLYEPSIEYQVAFSKQISLQHLPLKLRLTHEHLPQCGPCHLHMLWLPHQDVEWDAAGKPHRRPGSSRPEHCVGGMRACVPPGLHPAVAEDALCLPAVQ